MLDLVALIGAIAMIVSVQVLRASLAVPFARVRAELVPAVPPEPLAPLFDAAIAELAALGFGEARGVHVSRVDGVPALQPFFLVLRRADGTTAWLAPPGFIARPHHLMQMFATRLADGRVAVSQSFDASMAVAAVAPMLARTGTEATNEARVAGHDRWLDSLGSERLPADDAMLTWLAGDEMERIRQALLANGSLVPITPDLSEPSWGFAWRVLAAYFSMTKPAPIAGAIGPERLALFAQVIELVRGRSPRRSAQWLLFAGSVAAFMAIGAAFWGAVVAWSILVVIVIHELGHFLAMRAFGYRNVHMLALPLVGGVAMGHDANPAATRRAWMSLMGPLPGIAIGCALLAAMFLGAAPAWTLGFILPLGVMFLFINYLNLLPVPPLDGAHVVEAMLPTRLRGVQVVFVAVAASLGAWLAWQHDFTLLAFLAAIQLLGLPAKWKLRRVEGELAASAGWSSLDRDGRTLRALRAIERELGPAQNAKSRIDMASALVTRIDTKPMGHVSRLATAAVYLLVLALPVAALLRYPEFIPGAQAAEEAKYEAHARGQKELEARAKALGYAELLAPHWNDERTAAPATASDIADAEARLGAPLPAELRELLAAADGASEVGIAPVREWTTAAASIDELAALDVGDVLNIALGASEWRDVPFADARGWWRIGGDDEGGSLYYLPQLHPSLPGMRFVYYFLESPVAYPSVRAFLEAEWAMSEQSRQQMAERRANLLRKQQELAGAHVAALLALLPEPSLVDRTYLGDRYALPDAASPEAIAAVEARLGRTLPPDYRELLALHDGLPRFDVLPVAELETWDESLPDFIEYSRDIESLREMWAAQRVDETTPQGGVALPESFGNDDASHCIVVSVMRVSTMSTPRLLWCADERHWVDVSTGRSYRELREWLRTQVAIALVNAES